LDSLASYVQNMLTEMARDEVHMLLGVSGEIEKMDVKLKDLKNFLLDADKRSINDESVHAWVLELREAIYDANNILDICQLKAMQGASTPYCSACGIPSMPTRLVAASRTLTRG